ncbi:MAG: accessory Sec system translocase SecA2 [Bacillota bacterium]
MSRIKEIVNYINDFYNVSDNDVRPYHKTVEEINKSCLRDLSDAELRFTSALLRDRALKGESADNLLIEAYALVKEAAVRVLGETAFDTQLIAAIAMHQGKLAEMQTGEGKTLAAVFPSYLNALTGKGVHVLTFNDYLARRDAAWVGRIHEFLGLRVGYIDESMSFEKRRNAYLCDVTYVTAKEAGFDYLRDFLCDDTSKLVHKSFNYAIIDEADSILIDEARIPLVIAGDMHNEAFDLSSLSTLVRTLSAGLDYAVDQYGGNVYLTDSGIQKVEKALKCGNLFDEKNLELLTRINCALYAEKLLKKDKDYIVRNGKIEIVDEFTGRIAEKRSWPNSLQHAIEAKERLEPQAKGSIMGSITLQNFVSLYNKVAGMTGTARTAAGELKEFYNLDVLVIPTHKPCLRRDHPDMVFTHLEAKEAAILAEIQRVHNTGQPILIGTASVAESENLADRLRELGIQCQVLNAKNDEMEAHIIEKAGELGAVTVSTNMAGRGIDIKLGGKTGKYKHRIEELGGLYVLGTSRNENSRIDNQLRGRSGRQGDPGESRFFISLEDDIIRKYELYEYISAAKHIDRQDAPLTDPRIATELSKGQRLIEGYNSDIRRQLCRYSSIIEQQRRFIHRKRQSILLGADAMLLPKASPERYNMLAGMYGEEMLKKVERQLTLYYINKSWADYLDYISYIRESIHLMVIGGQNPLHEFHKLAIEAFTNMLDDTEKSIVNKFNQVSISEKGIDMDEESLRMPSSTWTYLISDNPDQFSNISVIVKGVLNYIREPLFSISSLFKKLKKKRIINR